MHYVSTFGNYEWEVLQNDFSDSPFFTCDFPAAIEKSDHPRILNRIVPLTHNLALRIRPDIMLKHDQVDLSFSNFRYRRHKVNREELAKLKRLIVRCAEDMVFYRDDRPWIGWFVARNRFYHIEPCIEKLKTSTGTSMNFSQSVSDST